MSNDAYCEQVYNTLVSHGLVEAVGGVIDYWHNLSHHDRDRWRRALAECPPSYELVLRPPK